MSINSLKMKNKTDSTLQKELEFYTNLLAQHAKNEQNKCSNLRSFSSSQPKRLCSTQPNKTLSSQTSSSYKLNNLNFLDNKRTYPPMLIAKKETPKKTFSAKKGILSASSNNNLNTHKKMSPNNIVKNSSFKSISYVKNSPRNITRISCKNNTKIDCDNNLKSISSKAFNSVQLYEKNCAKSDSQKLMGEIMAITQQLKLKSKTLGSSDKVKSFQKSQHHAFSKLAQKKTAKDSLCLTRVSKKEMKSLNIKSFDSVPPLHACTNRSKLISACASKSDAQMQTMYVATSFGNPVDPKNIQLKTAQTDMLKKLNAIEKVLANATEKTSKEMLTSNCMFTRFKDSKTDITCTTLPKELVLSDDNNLVSCAGSVTSDHKTAKKKSIIEHNLKFNTVAMENSILKTYPNSKRPISCQPSNVSDKTISRPKAANLLNTKYKVVNKIRTPGRMSLEKRASIESVKKRRRSLSTKKRSISTYTLINGDRKTFAHNRRSCQNYIPSFKKSSVKNSFFNSCMPSQYAGFPLKHKSSNALKAGGSLSYSTSKYHFSKTNVNISAKSPKNRSLDTVSGIQNSSNCDVDVDLLVELAAENKISPLLQRRVYKSKNRIINSHSVQARTARMIKSKYFNSSRRPFEWRNHVTAAKNFKGYSRNYISKRQESRNRLRKINHLTTQNFSNKFRGQKICLQKKKIVYLKGEKFIVGSSGKSLKKVTKQTSNYNKKTKRLSVYKKSPFKVTFSVKTSTPNSKIMASRVLNRSINRMLSASVKNKVHKVNTFCMFYNRFGRCNKGVQCPYVHDPSKIAVCTRFLRGTCKNDKCLFSHEISPGKMAICSFFLQDACTKEDCPYRHEKLSPDAELCKAFVQGYCPSGKKCKKAHVLICPKYIQGICDKGKDCVFPHPVDKEKKSTSKTPVVKKADDQILETVRRYFQSSPQESLVKGLVVPRIKTLPEQPSYISLTMDETS